MTDDTNRSPKRSRKRRSGNPRCQCAMAGGTCYICMEIANRRREAELKRRLLLDDDVLAAHGTAVS